MGCYFESAFSSFFSFFDLFFWDYIYAYPTFVVYLWTYLLKALKIFILLVFNSTY